LGRPPAIYSPQFEASYREVFTTDAGVAIPKAQREEAKRDAYAAWCKGLIPPPPDEIPEAPIADPSDTPAEALEKIVHHSLKSMTPSDAVKHRSQLLKFAGDTVLLDRKARIEKQSLASGLSIITELFRQVASGEVKQGPGWIDATVLPTLSAQEQAAQAVDTADALPVAPTPSPAQREAV
jgi:hypothetical protein